MSLFLDIFDYPVADRYQSVIKKCYVLCLRPIRMKISVITLFSPKNTVHRLFTENT